MAQHSYTTAQIDWLREHRPNLLAPELTAAFNGKFGTHLSIIAVKGTCKRHKFRSSTNGLYKPGDAAWNKGIKVPRRSVETEFKKGRIPHTYLPIGTEKKRDDHYIWQKIADPNVWRQKHRLIWESIHGPQPKGTTIIFLDGDRLNFEPENLKLITRRELLQLNCNKYTQAPPELKPTILALSKVEVAIFAAQSQVKGD